MSLIEDCCAFCFTWCVGVDFVPCVLVEAPTPSFFWPVVLPSIFSRCALAEPADLGPTRSPHTQNKARGARAPAAAVTCWESFWVGRTGQPACNSGRLGVPRPRNFENGEGGGGQGVTSATKTTANGSLQQLVHGPAHEHPPRQAASMRDTQWRIHFVLSSRYGARN